MTGRPRTASDAAILDAVAAVVTEVGPRGLTLAAVAERVGVSAPALTQRFGSKRGLLLAFATREADGMADIFEAARSDGGDALTVLIETLSRLPSAISTREGMANNLAFLQMDLVDPELRPHAVSQSRSLRREIARLLTEAVEAGDLDPSSDPSSLAADLYATYCGAMLTWAIDGSGRLTDWIRVHLERVLAPHRAG